MTKKKNKEEIIMSEWSLVRHKNYWEWVLMENITYSTKSVTFFFHQWDDEWDLIVEPKDLSFIKPQWKNL